MNTPKIFLPCCFDGRTPWLLQILADEMMSRLRSSLTRSGFECISLESRESKKTVLNRDVDSQVKEADLVVAVSHSPLLGFSERVYNALCRHKTPAILFVAMDEMEEFVANDPHPSKPFTVTTFHEVEDIVRMLIAIKPTIGQAAVAA